MKITVFASASVAILLIGFGAGFLTGREIPAHHYEPFGKLPLILDTTNGHICNPFLKSKSSSSLASMLFGKSTSKDDGPASTPCQQLSNK